MSRSELYAVTIRACKIRQEFYVLRSIYRPASFKRPGREIAERDSLPVVILWLSIPPYRPRTLHNLNTFRRSSLDALQHQFDLEDGSASGVPKAVLYLASSLPFPGPMDKAVEKIKEHLGVDSLDRIKIMLTTCMNEVRKYGERLSRLDTTEQQKETRAEVAKELLLDAARKAEATRSNERVRRIGLILANGITQTEPADCDEVEEMMRVAMELTDQDIDFLRELIRIEGHMLENRDFIDRFTAHMTWENGRWGARIEYQLDSVFSKLEGYGLVSRLAPPNNLNITADFQNRYVLLKKGLRFSDLIRETNSGARAE